MDKTQKKREKKKKIRCIKRIPQGGLEPPTVNVEDSCSTD